MYFLDEPTSALDGESADKIMKQLKRICLEKTSLFFSSKNNIINNPNTIFELKNKKLSKIGYDVMKF